MPEDKNPPDKNSPDKNPLPETRPDPGIEITPLEPAPTPRKVKVGGDVTVVTVRDGLTEGKVLAVRDKGKIDVSLEHRGRGMVITGSPYDPTAKMPDSWH